jgi:BirA family biotin operon repressor/biotin-[acetyl-CoA-carboxylase] ligase
VAERHPLSSKKVCGLLTEMSAEPDRVKHVVLGIGVDVNMSLDELPPDLRARTTTLSHEAGRRIDRTALLQQLLRDVEYWYRVLLTSDGDVLKEWESLNATIGSRVSVTGAGEAVEGTARGIDRDGRLLVRRDDGFVHTVAAGDVTVLNPAKRGEDHV